MPQDPGALVAQIKQLRRAGGDQPPQLSAQSQMPVATDPTLTGILPPSTSPVMPAWPGANPAASPYQIASEDIGRQRALADKIAPLLAEQRDMGKPQSPSNPEGYPQHWKPKYEPVTGVGSFLRDAGKGVLQALSLTGPGAAVEQRLYERKTEPYLTARGTLAQQIEEIQKQQEIEQKPIGPMGELAYHQELIGTKEEQNRIRQQLADQARVNEQDKDANAKATLQIKRQTADLAASRLRQQFDIAMKNFQLKARNLSREEARDQMDEMLRDQANKNYAARTRAGQEGKEAQLATQADIAQAKIDADKWFQRSWGSQPKIPPRNLRNPAAPTAPAGGGSVVDQLVKKHGG